MKIRDLFFLVIGGLLVVFGMVLNSVLVTDANADNGRDKFNDTDCNNHNNYWKQNFHPYNIKCWL